MNKELLKKLALSFGPSGYEKETADIIIEGLSYDIVAMTVCVAPANLHLIFQRIHLDIIVVGKPSIYPYTHFSSPQSTLRFRCWSAHRFHKSPYGFGREP